MDIVRALTFPEIGKQDTARRAGKVLVSTGWNARCEMREGNDDWANVRLYTHDHTHGHTIHSFGWKVSLLFSLVVISADSSTLSPPLLGFASCTRGPFFGEYPRNPRSKTKIVRPTIANTRPDEEFRYVHTYLSTCSRVHHTGGDSRNCNKSSLFFFFGGEEKIIRRNKWMIGCGSLYASSVIHFFFNFKWEHFLFLALMNLKNIATLIVQNSSYERREKTEYFSWMVKNTKINILTYRWQRYNVF